MYQFRTFKLGSSTSAGGWIWQVSKSFGPVEVVVAKSGVLYPTEDAAKQDFKAMVAYFSSHGSTPQSSSPANA